MEIHDQLESCLNEDDKSEIPADAATLGITGRFFKDNDIATAISNNQLAGVRKCLKARGGIRSP